MRGQLFPCPLILDRVSGQATRYGQISGDWHQESASWTYPESGSATPLTNLSACGHAQAGAVTRVRITGLDSAFSSDGASGILAAESVSIDLSACGDAQAGARGNQSVSRTVAT